MIRVRYVVAFQREDRPLDLPGDTGAVLAQLYKWCDIGQSAVTREEIHERDVQPLGAFPIGSELFVESRDGRDSLDDTDAESTARTRIWWRVEIVGRGPA